MLDIFLEDKMDTWINIKDDLPAQYKWIVFYDPRMTYLSSMIEICIGVRKEKGVWESNGVETKSVTHWQPLPKNPKS